MTEERVPYITSPGETVERPSQTDSSASAPETRSGQQTPRARKADTRFVLVIRRAYLDFGGNRRIGWYSFLRKAPDINRAILWLAEQVSKRDWRNSQVDVITAIRIEGTEATIEEVPDHV